MNPVRLSSRSKKKTKKKSVIKFAYVLNAPKGTGIGYMPDVT